MNTIKIPMQSPLFTKILFYIGQRKYAILLVSFLLLIFGNTFTENYQIFGLVNIYQNLLTGLLVFYNKKRLRNIILSIILVSVALDLFAGSFSFIEGKSWHGILYLIFFFLVVKEVSIEVLY